MPEPRDEPPFISRDVAPSDAIAPYWRDHAYDNRARAVYWNKATPACRGTGPSKATCLLPPEHDGPHYGNGFDEWGPKGRIWWEP